MLVLPPAVESACLGVNFVQTFILILRLLHDSQCQPVVDTERDQAPESPAPPIVPLLPDHVSDNLNTNVQISLPTTV